MSTYESQSPPNRINRKSQKEFKAHPIPVEHNTTDPSAPSQAPRRRRPDLSSFFATLREITPAPDHRPHAVPVPGDVSSAFLSLAEAFEVIRRDRGGDQPPEGGAESNGTDGDVLDNMIRILVSEADAPPREVQGASEEFCEGMASVLGLRAGAVLCVCVCVRRKWAHFIPVHCSPRPRPQKIPPTLPNLSHLQQSFSRRRIPARGSIALPPEPSLRPRVCAALATAEGYLSTGSV